MNNQSGWRRVGDPPAADQGQPPADPNDGSAPAAAQNYPGQPPAQNYPQNNYPQNNYPQNNGPQNNGPMTRPPMAPQADVPPSLHVAAGTFVTVRTNGAISSDQNHVGDAFSASLVRPLVVNGVVIAEPGQTISGQVVEAQKAGRIEGTARLRVQLTELTLVDGQQIPVRSQLIGRQGPTSVGRDAGAIAGTTGLGAAVGAAAGWGRGAAIGAGAGAAVGVLGVLLTRGHPSVIYPEEALTFRLEGPFDVDTTRSAQAFRYVQPNEYNQPVYNQGPPAPPAYATAPVAVGPAYPYPYGYGYPYPYWGPSVSFYYGRGWYGGPGWYRGGYGYHGWRR